MEKYLKEAFKSLDEIDTLNEEVFDISLGDDFDRAIEFEDEEPVDDREEEIIIDPLASEEEDLQDDYIGKVVLQCEICQSMIYKDPSEVVIDDELELANVEEACPFCQSEDGFKVIGEIKPFGEEEKEEEHEEEKEEEHTEDEEPVVDSEEESEEEAEDAMDESIKTRKKVRTEELEDEKIEESTNVEKIMKVLDSIGSIGESVEKCPVCHKVPCKCKKEEELKEDFQKVDIETDTQKMSMESDENGKVTVTTEPKEGPVAEASDEVIAPVSDEVREIIGNNKPEEEEMAEEPEYTDVDFDEFEESDFDELGESYLKRVYENVKSFKTTKGSVQGNQLKLEGLIKFKSGKQAKTNFVFEAYQATKTGKLKFIGENKQFAKGKKSFILSGRNDNKKLVCESLTYNYVGKSADGKSKRLYGTVKK